MNIILELFNQQVGIIVMLLLWLLLIIIGLKKKQNGSVFSAEQTGALRGICAIEIMLGHIGIATGSIFLFPNRKAGILFVGIFFLLSGYGLSCSIANKQDYLRGFLKNRLKKVLIPAYVVFAIQLLGYNIINGENSFWSQIFDLKLFFEATNWYVWECIALYIFFYVSYKYCAKYAEQMIWAICIGFIIVAFFLKIDNPWYGSTLCFPLGMLYYRHEDKVALIFENSIKRWGSAVLVLVGIVSIAILVFFALGEESFIGNLVARNIASVSFGMAAIVVLTRVRIINRVSLFLGKISYEIFLIHPTVILMLEEIGIESISVYAVLVVVVSVAVGYCLNRILKKAGI